MNEFLNEKIVIMDIDGTFFRDYKKVYKRIIGEIFGKNKAVIFINNFLYKINDLDIFSNTMFLFKCVILFYSIISFSSYRKNIIKFEKKYVNYAKKSIELEYDRIIKPIEQKGYKVLFISQDIFTEKLKKYVKNPIIIPKSKLVFVINNFLYMDVIFSVGNNYFDDILPAKILNFNSKKTKVVPVYIGKSRLAIKISGKNTLKFTDIRDFITKHF